MSRTADTLALAKSLRDKSTPFPAGWTHDGWLGWHHRESGAYFDGASMRLRRMGADGMSYACYAYDIAEAAAIHANGLRSLRNP